jgi:uncharacterized coiled-coil protein SlyX
MKKLIGYYNEQGIYIEELVEVVEKTKEELIDQKEKKLLKLTKELENLKKL